MKYILESGEYDDLVKAAKQGNALPSRGVQQKICTDVANNMPVPGGAEGPYKAPWGCILNPPAQPFDEPLLHNPGYCDNCPVSPLCPHPDKLWSQT